MIFHTFTCEWDIGINEKRFASLEIMKAHIAKALAECGIEEPLEELEDEYVWYDTDSFKNVISTMPE